MARLSAVTSNSMAKAVEQVGFVPASVAKNLQGSNMPEGRMLVGREENVGPQTPRGGTPQTMPKLSRTMSRIRDAVSRGATPHGSRPSSPPRSAPVRRQVSFRDSAVQDSVLRGSVPHMPYTEGPQQKSQAHPELKKSRSRRVSWAVAALAEDSTKPALPPADSDAWEEPVKPRRSQSPPRFLRADCDAPAQGYGARLPPEIDTDFSWNDGYDDMPDLAPPTRTPRRSRAASVMSEGGERSRSRRSRRRRSSGGKLAVVAIVAAVALVCGGGMLLAFKWVIDGVAQAGRGGAGQGGVVERVVMDPMGAPRVDSMDMEVLRQLTEMQQMLEASPRPARRSAVEDPLTVRAEQYYDAADGAAAATRVTLGSSGAAAALLGLVPGEVVTFAVLVAIIIGIPMAYMYRADRTQDGVDSGRVSPSGPFSPDDAMRRRSSRRLLSFLNSPRDAPANVPRQESMMSDARSTVSRSRSRSMFESLASGPSKTRLGRTTSMSSRASRMSAYMS